MIRIVCLLIGYVFGLFQTAYILGRLNGIDIREHGSGNSGTTNMLRTKGLKAGLTTLLCDMLKCVLAVVFVSFLFGSSYPDILPVLKLYAAAGVILGHDFPFYLGFKGGKGIAATAGFILAMGPLYVLVGLIVFFGVFLTTHYVSLGSLLIYVALIIQTVIMGQNGCFNTEQVTVGQNVLNEMYCIVFLLGVLAFYLHRENIKRLIAGNERKTYLSKKNKEEQSE